MRGAVLGDRGISIRLEGSWNMFGSYEDKEGESGGGRVNKNCSGLEGRVRQMLKCCRVPRK